MNLTAFLFQRLLSLLTIFPDLVMSRRTIRHLPQLPCPCPEARQFETFYSGRRLSQFVFTFFVIHILLQPNKSPEEKLSTSRGTRVVVKSKIEKVPRGIQGVNSRKDTASSVRLAPKGTEPGVRKGKRSLLACHTRCKCSMEATHNSVKVKLGI